MVAISTLLFPLCWEWAAAGVANSLRRYGSAGKLPQGFMLKVVCVEESARVCLVRGTRDAEGLRSCCLDYCWSWTRLWPPAWENHTSLWSVWDSPCKQSALWKPLFHPCSPGGQEKLVLGSVHPGTSLQQLPACQLLTVPDIPDLLQWHRCPSLLQKGLLFTVFLYKIWSCLVVTTEWLGSAGSPKFSSLFGHRLQLCAYIL